MPYTYRVLPGGRRVVERPAAALVEGSSESVLAAVGDDPAAAQRYLERELESTAPRKILVSKLERLAADA